MLTIKEVENKTIAEQFLLKKGIEVSLTEDIVMTCMDRDECLGVAALTLKEEGKVYLDLVKMIEDDLSFAHGMAKSILNLADLRGIKQVYGKNPELSRLYQMLQFTEQDGEYVLSLEGYFTQEKH
ncbi:MAG: hypothetical protein IJA08_07060 [Clostridia bacterium]|nr:hypothetical protein [Clostridia bacterium]